MIFELLLGAGSLAAGAAGGWFAKPQVAVPATPKVPYTPALTYGTPDRCYVRYVNGVEHHSCCQGFPRHPDTFPEGAILKDTSHLAE